MSVIRAAFFARLMQTTCVGFALTGVLLTTGCAHHQMSSSELATAEAAKPPVALATALQAFAIPDQSFAYAQGVDINQMVVPGADLSSTLAPINLQSRSIGPVTFIESAPIMEKPVEAPVAEPVVESKAEEMAVPASEPTPPVEPVAEVIAPPMVVAPAPEEVKLAEAHDATPLVLTPPAPEPTKAAEIVAAPVVVAPPVEDNLPAGTKPLLLPVVHETPAPAVEPKPLVEAKPVELKAVVPPEVAPVAEPVALAPAPVPVLAPAPMAPPPVVVAPPGVMPPVTSQLSDGTKPLMAPAEVVAVAQAPAPTPTVTLPTITPSEPKPTSLAPMTPVEAAVANANDAVELGASMGVASQVVVQPSNAGVNLWQAQSGQTLHEVLAQWCSRANVQLVWSSEYDFPLGASIALNDNFENAIRTLLTGLSAASPQPIGSLHRQANTGSSVLIIETRGNMYEDQ